MAWPLPDGEYNKYTYEGQNNADKSSDSNDFNQCFQLQSESVFGFSSLIVHIGHHNLHKLCVENEPQNVIYKLYLEWNIPGVIEYGHERRRRNLMFVSIVILI